MSQSEEVLAAVPSVMVDDGRVRVTRWRFEPGASTGVHTHEFDYIVIPVTGGDFTVEGTDGSSAVMRQVPGETYAREAGITHDLTNSSGHTVEFVEVELLQT